MRFNSIFVHVSNHAITKETASYVIASKVFFIKKNQSFIFYNNLNLMISTRITIGIKNNLFPKTMIQNNNRIVQMSKSSKR